MNLGTREQYIAEFFGVRSGLPHKMAKKRFKFPHNNIIKFRDKVFPIDMDDPTYSEGANLVFAFNYTKGIPLKIKAKKKIKAKDLSMEDLERMNGAQIEGGIQLNYEEYQLAIQFLDYVCNNSVIFQLLRASDIKVPWSQIIMYVVFGLAIGGIIGFLIAGAV